jgi:hypothetical protein
MRLHKKSSRQNHNATRTKAAGGRPTHARPSSTDTGALKRDSLKGLPTPLTIRKRLLCCGAPCSSSISTCKVCVRQCVCACVSVVCGCECIYIQCVSMCVCVCVYIHICVCVCTYICVYVLVRGIFCLCVYCLCRCLCVCLCVRVCAGVCVWCLCACLFLM